MFALNQRLPCVRGAGAGRLRGWRDVFKVVRCSALRTANPSVIFLRKCHLPLHKGGLKGEFAAICLVLTVCFMRAIQYFASLHGTLASQVCDRPYGAEQNIICRGDSRIARNVVRSFFRLRTNKQLSLDLGRAGACSRRKVVRAIFRLQPMFAFNQSLPLGGEGGIDEPT